jgi:hypothetical protein
MLSHAFAPASHCGTHGWRRRWGMFEKLQNANAITRAQRYKLMPGYNLFGSRQRGAHHEGRKIEVFVGGSSGKNALFLARGAQFDPIVSGS